MDARTTTLRAGRRFWLCVPVLAVALILAGCSGESDKQEDTSSSQQQETQSNQGPMGKAPSISAEDVTDEQIQQAARVAMSVRMGMQEDRMKLQKDMKNKYGNPKQMDSTQKAKAQKEVRRRQMKLQKKQKKMMKKEAEKEGMESQMFQQIMRTARKDSTLRKRLQTAMKSEMQKRMKERMQGKMKQKGSNQ